MPARPNALKPRFCGGTQKNHTWKTGGQEISSGLLLRNICGSWTPADARAGSELGFPPVRPFVMDATKRIPVEPENLPWVESRSEIRVMVEVQGTVARCRVVKGPADRPAPLRGKVYEFSRASRLAMLRMVNRIDFDQVGRSTFATLTYPDESLPLGMADLTANRDAFQKVWERFSAGPRPGLWRVEWEKRKSGRYRGTFAPHIHCLWFGCPKWPQAEARDAWHRIIGTRVKPRLELKEATGPRRVGFYVSKYIGKMPPPCYLVIDAYLAAVLPGRKWGVLRKESIPWCPKRQTEILQGSQWDVIRTMAKDSWKGCPNDGEQGFTLFGKGAEMVSEYLATIGVDAETPSR